MMYSGSVLPVMVVAPRMWMESQPAEVRVIMTPGTLDWRTFSIGCEGFWARSSAVTVAPVSGRVGDGSGRSLTGAGTRPRQPRLAASAHKTDRRSGNDAI